MSEQEGKRVDSQAPLFSGPQGYTPATLTVRTEGGTFVPKPEARIPVKDASIGTFVVRKAPAKLPSNYTISNEPRKKVGKEVRNKEEDELIRLGRLAKQEGFSFEEEGGQVSAHIPKEYLTEEQELKQKLLEKEQETELIKQLVPVSADFFVLVKESGSLEIKDPSLEALVIALIQEGNQLITNFNTKPKEELLNELRDRVKSLGEALEKAKKVAAAKKTSQPTTPVPTPAPTPADQQSQEQSTGQEKKHFIVGDIVRLQDEATQKIEDWEIVEFIGNRVTVQNATAKRRTLKTRRLYELAGETEQYEKRFLEKEQAKKREGLINGFAAAQKRYENLKAWSLTPDTEKFFELLLSKLHTLEEQFKEDRVSPDKFEYELAAFSREISIEQEKQEKLHTHIYRSENGLNKKQIVLRPTVPLTTQKVATKSGEMSVEEWRKKEKEREAEKEKAKKERAAKTIDELFDHHERMYQEDPEEYIKIYKHKNYLPDDPTKNVVEKILGDIGQNLEPNTSTLHNKSIRENRLVYKPYLDPVRKTTNEKKELTEEDIKLRESAHGQITTNVDEQKVAKKYVDGKEKDLLQREQGSSMVSAETPREMMAHEDFPQLRKRFMRAFSERDELTKRLQNELVHIANLKDENRLSDMKSGENIKLLKVLKSREDGIKSTIAALKDLDPSDKRYEKLYLSLEAAVGEYETRVGALRKREEELEEFYEESASEEDRIELSPNTLERSAKEAAAVLEARKANLLKDPFLSYPRFSPRLAMLSALLFATAGGVALYKAYEQNQEEQLAKATPQTEAEAPQTALSWEQYLVQSAEQKEYIEQLRKLSSLDLIKKRLPSNNLDLPSEVSELTYDQLMNPNASIPFLTDEQRVEVSKMVTMSEKISQALDAPGIELARKTGTNITLADDRFAKGWKLGKFFDSVRGKLLKVDQQKNA